MPQPSRGVAQPGSASHWGCGGRWFESSRPDHPSHEPSLRRHHAEDHPKAMESPQVPMSTATLLMQATPAGSAEPSGTTSILMGIVPWLLIFVIFYMLLIRPQQRRVKEHPAAFDAVFKSDAATTGGGIRGRVTKVGDDEAEVEIANGVKVRVVKSTISHVVTGKTRPAND